MGRISLWAAAVAASFAGGYAGSQRLVARRPAPATADEPATAVRSPAPARIRLPHSAASLPADDLPSPAPTITVPASGSLDRLLLEPGNERFLKIRNAVVVDLATKAIERCGPLHRNGDTQVDLFAEVTLHDGELAVARISRVEVTKGAPLGADAEACLAGLVKAPLRFSPPPPPPGAPPYVLAGYDGRWKGFPEFDGDVVARLSFSDRLDCPAMKGERPR